METRQWELVEVSTDWYQLRVGGMPIGHVEYHGSQNGWHGYLSNGANSDLGYPTKEECADAAADYWANL